MLSRLEWLVVCTCEVVCCDVTEDHPRLLTTADQAALSSHLRLVSIRLQPLSTTVTSLPLPN